MMNDMDKRFGSKELSEMLGVEAVTVRKYAAALEKAGYIFERSDKDHRLYTSQDAMVFQHLKSLREHSGLNVESASNVVVSRHQVASESVALVPKLYEPDRYAEQYRNLDEKIDRLTELLLHQQELSAAAARSLPDPRDELRERVNERLTERRINRKLETEALDLWNAKPMTERLRRVSFFRKEEDTIARERFIRNYVDEHYEERLKEAYGLI